MIRIGSIVAFTPDASCSLHDIPATVTAVQPLADGGALLALEYAEPVCFGKALIRHIDAHSADVVEVRCEVVDFGEQLDRAA